MGGIWQREPVAVVNAIRLVILAAVSFGLKWTPEQIVAAMAALEAVLTLLQRSQVVPVKDPATIITKNGVIV